MIRLFSDWIENTGRDLRFVLRSLAKTPGFTATAIVVLAVGIGPPGGLRWLRAMRQPWV